MKTKEIGDEIDAVVLKMEYYMGNCLFALSSIFLVFIWFFRYILGSGVGDSSTSKLQSLFLVVYLSAAVIYIFSALYKCIREKKRYAVLRSFLICIVSIVFIHNILNGRAITWQEGQLIIEIMLLLTASVAVYLVTRINYGESMPSGKKRLVSYRSDLVYVPYLLGKIENEELKMRIAHEVCTYVYGARKYKYIYNGLSFLSIFFPAAVVALNSINENVNSHTVVATSLLSMLTVIVTGVLGTMKAKESWLRYRKYAEAAKKQLIYYEQGINEYKDCENKDEKLAEKMEELFEKEQKDWIKLRKED